MRYHIAEVAIGQRTEGLSAWLRIKAGKQSRGRYFLRKRKGEA